MKKSIQRQAGVTLIEMLIAITLLSLLSAGVLIAMRLGFNTMDKTDARLVSNRRVTSARRILENEIYGFIHTMADYIPQPNVLLVMPFVQTEPQSMRFVTSYSLEDGWRGSPRIAELQVIPGEKNQGVRLILNETPYTGPAQAGQSIVGIEKDPVTGLQFARYKEILPGPQSFVLADRLAFCRFSYLEQRPEPPFQVWSPFWIPRPQLLLGIRIEMAPLDTTPVNLHVTTVTAPVNINFTPGSRYVD
jgi:prepilin-type N-terminal cleavage/methylation domain-containing protein